MGDEITRQSLKNESIPRRKILGMLGAASTGALAGCSGGDDDDVGDDDVGDDDAGDDDAGDDDAGGEVEAGEAGERVPTVILTFWNDAGDSTEFFEDSMELLASGLGELGLDIDVQGVAQAELIDAYQNDARINHIDMGAQGPIPARLDPQELIYRYNLFLAGANGQNNNNNYANCDYTTAAVHQRRAVSPEERQELVTEALQVMSHDVSHWPIVENFAVGAYNSNEVDAGGLGEFGMFNYNFNFYNQSVATNDDNILLANISGEMTDTRLNNLVASGATALTLWNNQIYSPLMDYNENFELEPCLAEDYETNDDGDELTFYLGDNTFHDGEPITADDVQYTWEFIPENTGQIPQAEDYPIDEVEVVDDETVIVHLRYPTTTVLEQALTMYGVFPQHVFEPAGADDDPGGFDLEGFIEDEYPDLGLDIIGSGPFRVTNFSADALHLEPHDGHRKHQPESDLILQTYSDSASALRGFEQGEINVVFQLSPGMAVQLEDMQEAEVVESGSFALYHAYPMANIAPGKFQEWREAGHRAIDRVSINEVATQGISTPWPVASPFSVSHPYFPGQELEDLDDNDIMYVDPSGDPDAGREVLEENGWTWDDDDRLVYPDDADLSPLWPAGSEPAEHPEDFPCVEELEDLL